MSLKLVYESIVVNIETHTVLGILKLLCDEQLLEKVYEARVARATTIERVRAVDGVAINCTQFVPHGSRSVEAPVISAANAIKRRVVALVQPHSHRVEKVLCYSVMNASNGMSGTHRYAIRYT